MRSLIVLLFSLLLFVQGCESSVDNNDISKKASEKAVVYLKKVEHIDFEVTNVEFSKGTNSSTVFVNGHAKDTKQEYSVTINYEDNYKVHGYGRN